MQVPKGTERDEGRNHNTSMHHTAAELHDAFNVGAEEGSVWTKGAPMLAEPRERRILRPNWKSLHGCGFTMVLVVVLRLLEWKHLATAHMVAPESVVAQDRKAKFLPWDVLE